jgi:hypothetical protein
VAADFLLSGIQISSERQYFSQNISHGKKALYLEWKTRARGQPQSVTKTDNTVRTLAKVKGLCQAKNQPLFPSISGNVRHENDRESWRWSFK